MRPGQLLIVGIVPAFALGVLAGCSSSSKSSSTATTSAATTVPSTNAPSGTTIHVILGDTSGIGGPMTLVANPAAARAGDMTFVVKNAGTIDHEMIVLKTNVAYNKLPVVDSGDPPAPVKTGADKVDEGTKVGETGGNNLKPGETRTFTITNMTAGNYALVCNIGKHYQRGMRARFTVT
jgi:uncharacterized cupredoxin-like copper-binding protein